MQNGQKTIVVDVAPDGSISIDAQCFTGSGCADATQELELLLGGGEAKSSKKPEYYSPPGISTAQTTKMTF